MPREGTYVLISIGPHGFTAYEKPQGNISSRLSGYRTKADKIVEDLVSREGYEVPDGTPIVDKVHLEGTEGFIRNVFAEPIPDPKLSEGEWDRPEASPFFAAALMEANRGNGMSLLLAKHQTDKTFTGLSACSIPDYVAWWSTRGARIGVVMDGQITWLPQPEESTNQMELF